MANDSLLIEFEKELVEYQRVLLMFAEGAELATLKGCIEITRKASIKLKEDLRMQNTYRPHISVMN